MNGTTSVPVKELLTDSFVRAHTWPVMSQAAWLVAAPPIPEEVDSTVSNAFDSYVCSTTTFSTWHAMLRAAATECATAKLFR
jgi:hypothetical protein